MIKLLLITSNRVGRGTYWRAVGFAEELVKLGYEVTCLVVASNRWSKIVTYEKSGVTIVETPDLMPTSGYDLWDLFCRLRWVNGRSFDLIHAFESRPITIFPALFLQKRRKIPLVLDWCDWFGRGGSVEERPNRMVRGILRPIETFFEQTFRAHAQGTTVINSVLRQKALDLGVGPETILMLPNGALVADLPIHTIDSVRARLDLPQGVPILGYTGAMFRQDAELMAMAFEAIYKLSPDVRLLLIGYTNIDVAALMPTASEAVIRTGPVNYAQLLDYVSACNIGWLTLKNIGANQGRFPLKVYDFMRAARPLLVTNVADLGVMVRDKGIGLVTADDPLLLAETTLELIHDEMMQKRLGEQGRHVLMTEFAQMIVTQKLDRFYREILNV